MLDKVLRQRGFKGYVATHWIPWFKKLDPTQKPGGPIIGNYHPMKAYNQNDPAIIDKQLQVMNWAGIQVVLITNQGPFSSFQHASTMAMVQQLQQWPAMKFAIVADPWQAKEEASKSSVQNMNDVYNHADMQKLINHAQYIPEKAILDFNVRDVRGSDMKARDVPFDWSTVAALKGHPIWGLNTGFAWSHDDGNEDAIVNLKKQYARTTMRVGYLSMSFFDGGMPRTLATTSPDTLAKLPYDPVSQVHVDFNVQAWAKETDKDLATKVARYTPDRAGNYAHDQMDCAPLSTIPYMAWETWNDYTERTQMESWCSLFSGIRIG